MAKHLGPRLAGTLDGVISQVVVAILIGGGAAFASWYQGVLKAQHDAGVHLGTIGSAVAGLSPWVVVAVAALIVFGVALGAILLARRVGRPHSVEQGSPAEAAPTSALLEKIDKLTHERDELRHDLQAAKAHPPIYYEQVLELGQFDPRRLALSQTTETIRRLNPVFFNVDELNRTREELSAAKTEIGSLKKQNVDAVKEEAAKCQSQIEAMLLAYAEREQERDAARAELNDALAELEKARALAYVPLVRGRVMRFEYQDARELSEPDFKELDQEMRSPSSISGGRYLAAIEIETRDKASRATGWTFTLKSKDGSALNCIPVSRIWSTPATWPRVEKYWTLDEIQSTFLDAPGVYTIVVYVIVPGAPFPDSVDMLTFEADFQDSNGTHVVCRMPGAQSLAEKILSRLSETGGFKEEVRDFSGAIREALVGYHGTRTADAEVPNAMRDPFLERLLRLNKRLEKRLNRRILATDSHTFTVKAWAQIADDLEDAAALLDD